MKKFVVELNSNKVIAFPHKEKAKVGFTNSPFENKPVAAIDPAIRPP